MQVYVTDITLIYDHLSTRDFYHTEETESKGGLATSSTSTYTNLKICMLYCFLSFYSWSHLVYTDFV